MEVLLWSLVVLFTAAVLVDKVMMEESVRAWRDSTRELREKIDKLDIYFATSSANIMFQGLFDSIYGEKFWSKKRFLRSYMSSIIALCSITLLLGWETTHFGQIKLELNDVVFFTLVIVFVINTAADYVSLQETRLVLGRSKNSGMIGLSFWFVIDIAATTIIYLVVFYITFFILALIKTGNIFLPHTFFKFITKMAIEDHVFINRNEGLVFFLSTFLTSGLWFLFIASALLVRAMQRASPVLRLALDAIAGSDAPARATAGILSILLVLGFGLAEGIAWIIGI